MYKSRKPIALFLTVMLCITLVTAHYSKTQVHGVTETIVAPYVLDAVAKLLVAVSGAYIIEKINEEHDMDLTSNDVVQTADALKTLYHIFLTTDGFKLEDKQTGEEVNISADTSSVAGHLITGTTPTDAHDRAFYQWYNQNVSKKLGQYHIRVRQWSDTYGQYIDRFYAKDNPLELYQYVPTEYKDDFLQLFADMQEMVKSGFETNGYEKGFIKPVILGGYNQWVNYTTGEQLVWNTAVHKDSFRIMVENFVQQKVNEGKYAIVYTYSVIPNVGQPYIAYSDYPFNVYGQNPDFYYQSAYASYIDSDVGRYSLYHPDVLGTIIYSSHILDDSYYEEESSPVAFPLFPPVVDDSGNVALDHGDVQEVPVEEDQDGVPFVPDDWWTSVFDDFFGQTIPGDYDGSLTDMTQTQLLQEIASNTKPPNFTIVDLDAIYEKLKEKFGMFYQIKEFFEAIMNEDYSNPQRPQFTITFTGQLGINGTYEFLNLDLYDQYRDYIFAFIVATGWFVTLKRIFGYIPKVLN